MDPGQAGTWDPSLQCLHMESCLLQKQNTDCKGLKITVSALTCAVWANHGQATKRPKTPWPLLSNQQPKKQKSGAYGAWPLHSPPPQGWASLLTTPLGQTLDTPLLTSIRSQLNSLSEQARGAVCPRLPLLRQGPREALPESLVWPLINFY